MRSQHFRIILLFISVITIQSFLTTCIAQKKNNTTTTSQIKGDDGVILRIDVAYAINKKKVVVNNQYIEYTVTNIGTSAYNGISDGKKNSLVFDLSTKDGKTIEKTVSFREMLYPGKSTVIKYFIADVGPKTSCTGVTASRIDYTINN